MKNKQSGSRALPDHIRILFMATVDAGNTNAQSLNAREIAIRLDPARFMLTCVYEHAADPRLRQRPNIRLVKLPDHNRTWTVLREMFSHQLIAYTDYSPATYVFVHLPRALRGKALTVRHVEAPAGQLDSATRSLKFLYSGVAPSCDVNTAITDFVLHDMQEHGFSSEYILPVGVDTDFFVPPASRQNSKPIVLFVGTIIERKGPHLVVNAAQQIPQAIFHIVGSGRGGFEEKLRQQVRESGISNVQFLGPRSQTDLLAIMQHSDIFLLPSRLEGIPKVTLEAAATGLPCVVFRDYETPSVIDGKTGFQVTTFDEMLVRLRCLIRDLQLRQQMSAASVQHARSFDWNVVAPRWQDAYLKIVERARLR